MYSTSPLICLLFVFVWPGFPRQHRPSWGCSEPCPAASFGPVCSHPTADMEERHRPALRALRMPDYRCVCGHVCVMRLDFYSFFFFAQKKVDLPSLILLPTHIIRQPKNNNSFLFNRGNEAEEEVIQSLFSIWWFAFYIVFPWKKCFEH